MHLKKILSFFLSILMIPGDIAFCLAPRTLFNIQEKGTPSQSSIVASPIPYKKVYEQIKSVVLEIWNSLSAAPLFPDSLNSIRALNAQKNPDPLQKIVDEYNDLRPGDRLLAEIDSSLISSTNDKTSLLEQIVKEMAKKGIDVKLVEGNLDIRRLDERRLSLHLTRQYEILQKNGNYNVVYRLDAPWQSLVELYSWSIRHWIKNSLDSWIQQGLKKTTLDPRNNHFPRMLTVSVFSGWFAAQVLGLPLVGLLFLVAGVVISISSIPTTTSAKEEAELLVQKVLKKLDEMDYSHDAFAWKVGIQKDFLRPSRKILQNQNEIQKLKQWLQWINDRPKRIAQLKNQLTWDKPGDPNPCIDRSSDIKALKKAALLASETQPLFVWDLLRGPAQVIGSKNTNYGIILKIIYNSDGQVESTIGGSRIEKLCALTQEEYNAILNSNPLRLLIRYLLEELSLRAGKWRGVSHQEDTLRKNISPFIEQKMSEIFESLPVLHQELQAIGLNQPKNMVTLLLQFKKVDDPGKRFKFTGSDAAKWQARFKALQGIPLSQTPKSKSPWMQNVKIFGLPSVSTSVFPPFVATPFLELLGPSLVDSPVWLVVKLGFLLGSLRQIDRVNNIIFGYMVVLMVIVSGLYASLSALHSYPLLSIGWMGITFFMFRWVLVRMPNEIREDNYPMLKQGVSLNESAEKNLTQPSSTIEKILTPLYLAKYLVLAGIFTKKRGRIYMFENPLDTTRNSEKTINMQAVIRESGNLLSNVDQIVGIIAHIDDESREIRRMQEAGLYVPLYLVEGTSSLNFKIVRTLSPEEMNILPKTNLSHIAEAA